MHRCSCQGHQPTDLLRLEISIFFTILQFTPHTMYNGVFFQCYCYTQLKKTSSTLAFSALVKGGVAHKDLRTSPSG